MRELGAGRLRENLCQFARSVNQNVGRSRLQRMWGKTVTHAHAPEPSVACGFHVDMRIGNDRSLFRKHAILFEQLASAFGIGFLAGEAVPTIDLRETRA